MTHTVLVLDLDGTVLLGDAPVLAYAYGISEAVGDRVAAFLADPHGDPDLLDAQDGYQATARAAKALGLTRAQTQPAFLASRAVLAGDGVSAPPGLAELLSELPSYVVLVTNSPADGLPEVLDRLGLAAHIDRVRTDAHKPTGMPTIVDRLLMRHHLTERPWQLMSVGDIWRNDLAYAYERGCVTGYIDRHGRRQGPAHVTAPDFPGLYDAIRRWAEDPRALVS